ncbi:MAG: TetR family transcriptional regulator C-terminal domain-containing protein [Pseudomonadales bacterium]
MPKIVDHEARRRDFIDAAYQSILEDGLARTTIRAVARRAGYTTGALVHYFKDKDELIRHVLEENGKQVRLRMQEARSAAQGRRALREVMLEALPTNRVSGASWRIWLALWYHSEETAAMRREERRRYTEWIGRLSEILEECVALGELRATADLSREARSLVALVDGIGVQYLMNNGRLAAREVTAMLDAYLEKLFD